MQYFIKHKYKQQRLQREGSTNSISEDNIMHYYLGDQIEIQMTKSN